MTKINLVSFYFNIDNRNFYICILHDISSIAMLQTCLKQLNVLAGRKCLWIWGGARAVHSNNQLHSYLLVEISTCLQLPEKKVSKASTCG